MYFYERDCSVQRRHQKLIEEAPSVHLSDEQRRDIGERAVNGALSVGYTAPVEFLLDDDGNLSFMEMNARIQVEHPVSEMITSSDLIQEQIRVASGEPLSVSQESLTLRGHSIECRINAEDPDKDFAPAAGRLDVYEPPGGPGTRVDSHCYPGWTIAPFYDSLIAKLIVWAPDRTGRSTVWTGRCPSSASTAAASRPRSPSTGGFSPTSSSARGTSPRTSSSTSCPTSRPLRRRPSEEAIWPRRYPSTSSTT